MTGRLAGLAVIVMGKGKWRVCGREMMAKGRLKTDSRFDCGVFRRPLALIFHRLFRRYLVDEAGNAHAAFERFVVFEVQFGRFEEFDAFR